MCVVIVIDVLNLAPKLRTDETLLDLCRANTNTVDFDFSQLQTRSYDQKFGLGIIQLKVVVSHQGTNIRYTAFHGRYCLVFRCY